MPLVWMGRQPCEKLRALEWKLVRLPIADLAPIQATVAMRQ